MVGADGVCAHVQARLEGALVVNAAVEDDRDAALVEGLAESRARRVEEKAEEAHPPRQDDGGLVDPNLGGGWSEDEGAEKGNLVAISLRQFIK